jgi:hypothetical protein
MRDYKAYINQAIASCQAAFFDQSIYLSQALRDQHIRNLRKYIDNDAATLQEEMELMDLIQLINDISATLQPSLCSTRFVLASTATASARCIETNEDLYTGHTNQTDPDALFDSALSECQYSCFSTS